MWKTPPNSLCHSHHQLFLYTFALQVLIKCINIISWTLVFFDEDNISLKLPGRRNVNWFMNL